MAIGKKTGGRRKGTPNKFSVANAERIVDEAKKTGRRLAIARMAEAVDLCFGLAAKYQPGAPEYDMKEFKYWIMEAMKGCADLMPYQSPKLQSTTLIGTGEAGELVHRLEIEVVPRKLTHEAAITRSVSPVIEHEGKV